MLCDYLAIGTREAVQAEAVEWDLWWVVEREGGEQLANEHAELEAMAGEAGADHDVFTFRVLVEDEVFVGGEVVHAVIEGGETRVGGGGDDVLQEGAH